ncbi:MAG: chemotaxis protein CheD [Deltaproteobacteria bacterium]|nr:chemotaxis protein CheD [Deltaproteobacteria bacterium]
MTIDIDERTHYLISGTLFAHKEPYVVTTVLGSCIAVTLFDPKTKIGGINHFMMPVWNGQGLPTPKYGNIAMKILLEKVIRLGASKDRLQAKVFGGAALYAEGSKILNIGGKNTVVAKEFLEENKIPVMGIDTGGNYGRRIQLFIETGKVTLKMLTNSAIDRLKQKNAG